MKGGTKGVRLTSKVSRGLVIASPIVNVINHFQCHQDLHTSYIQFIKTSCIYLGALFLKYGVIFSQIWGNFNFKQCDLFKEKRFVWLG